MAMIAITTSSSISVNPRLRPHLDRGNCNISEAPCRGSIEHS
jgi:hypothetical protein